MAGETVPRCAGVRLTVADLERSAPFYVDVLGFEGMAATADEIELRMGEMRLALRRAAPQALRPMPPDSRANDRWFRHIAIVVRDMGAAFERLRTYGVELISSAPQTLPDWNPASGGIEALYFRDPDGHPLELIRFPPDKRKAAWRGTNEELFLGVDHSAIVVADTTASVAFYRDEIGLSVIAEAHNFGAEQAALSGLPGACVQVTSLLGRGTFGLELMEYLAPRGGRPMPADTGADDLWWTETLIELDSPEGERRLLRDPDGHTGEMR
ncbi:MAG: VOC family protein [Gammaproteobacteria bacterium]